MDRKVELKVVSVSNFSQKQLEWAIKNPRLESINLHRTKDKKWHGTLKYNLSIKVNDRKRS